MRIREATLDDKSAWDSFVENEGGSFCHYFDWKYVHEAGGREFLPLLIDAAPSQLVGILPIVKENRLLYSTLDSGSGGGAQGFLLKRELSDNERHEAISALLEHVDTHYARRCSSFKLAETATAVGKLSEEPTATLVSNGFRFRYDRGTHLPCSYVMELKQPFEENVWNRWSHSMRRAIDKTATSGVVAIHDRELQYVEDFVHMSYDNYKRHGVNPPTRDEIMAQLDVFRDRRRLFVALLDGHPIVALLCHYTPSTCYLARVGSHEKDTDNANKLCYKMAIEDACNRGYRFADFGYTQTEGLAYFKERFKGTRVPVRVYEKRYSIARTIMEKAPILVRNAWHDKGYIWRNRRRLWDRIVRM